MRARSHCGGKPSIDPVLDVLQKNQDRLRNQRELLLESLIGTNQRGHRSRRLSFVGNERIFVHGFHGFRVTRKPLVRKVEDMGMRREMAQSFENREGEIGRGQVMGEAFADQPSQFSLVIERIKARDDTTSAVTEQKKGQVRFSRFCHLDYRLNVSDVILKILNVEALAIRISASAQVDGVHGQTCCNKLLSHPRIVAAVGVEARKR